LGPAFSYVLDVFDPQGVIPARPGIPGSFSVPSKSFFGVELDYFLFTTSFVTPGVFVGAFWHKGAANSMLGAYIE
jgi:hypothetical protein